MNEPVAPADLPGLRSTAMATLRALERLDALYLVLRGSGLKEALPQPGSVQVGGRLQELFEDMRALEHALDWELTSELVRLKDLLREATHAYARAKYGMAINGHIKLPTQLPNLPERVRVAEIAFVDDGDYELRVTGNPVRPDGSILSDRVELMVAPDGIKVRLADGSRRERLRAQVGR